MLQHYVFLRYAPGTPEEHIAEFARRMLDLRSQIAGIEHLAIGRDILHDARSWDLVLDMRFASIELLRQYQRHPAHQAVVEFNKRAVAEIGSVDFFLPGSSPA